MARVSSVLAGETHRRRLLTRVFGSVDETVTPPCGSDSGTVWCVTHDELLDGDDQAGRHLAGRSTHRLAFICDDHGAEPVQLEVAFGKPGTAQTNGGGKG